MIHILVQSAMLDSYHAKKMTEYQKTRADLRYSVKNEIQNKC